jgi:hypothetical protein
MNELIKGALVGLAISAVLLIFEYMGARKSAAERAKRNHLTLVELDSTEKKRLGALARFCVALPPALAIAFWLLDKA